MATARHQWCLTKLTGSFGTDAAKVFFNLGATKSKFTDLFSGSGNRTIFVYEQANKSLACSDGSDDMTDCRVAYFVRTLDKPINTETENDKNIVYAELGSSPLADLEKTLSLICTPLLEGKVWGKANDSQSQEFKVEMNKFANQLKEAVKGKQLLSSTKDNTTNVSLLQV
jgi:hypothetical protein